jgi:hypothetical protein
MWEDPYKGNFPRDTWQIMGIDEEWDNIALDGNARGYISWSISGIQDLLKSEYKIVENKNLYEQQDDEWDLEAGDEWNVTELGIGDHITLDMLNQDNQIHLKHFLAVFEPNTFPLLIDKGNFNNYVVLRPEKGGRGYLWTINVINNIFLKPEYQIIQPLNESDDEWDLEADEEWNIKDLTAGDYITQEMLNDTPFTKAWRALNQDIKIVGFKKDPFVRDTLCVVEYIDEWNETRQNDIDIESFNKYFLKPGYRIVAP